MDQKLAFTALLGMMETAVNRALQQDPATLRRFASLAGRIIAIHCTSPQLTLYLRPHEQGLILQGVCEQTPDCEISGTAAGLMGLISADDKTTALLEHHISLSGDVELSRALQRIVSDLDIDWEAKLAEYLGDIAAHQIGQQVRSLCRWQRNARHSLQLNIEEYLHEESRDLPPQAELTPFYRAIDTLALDTDRLEARIERLHQQLAKPHDLHKDTPA